MPVSTVQIANPSGVVDDVLCIDNDTNEEVVYSFGNIIPLNGVYTFSCWFRSDTTLTTKIRISASSEDHQVGTGWARAIFTATAYADSPVVSFSIPAGKKLYAYKGQLEAGNKATDWAASPDDLKGMVQANTTAISVINGSISTLISQTETIRGEVTEINSKYSQIEQEVDSLNATISSHSSTIDELTGDIERVSDQQSSLQLDLNGFKTTVSNTYAKQSDLTSLTNTLNSAIEQSASEIELSVSRTYATKDELSGKADSDSLISLINVSSESVKISSSKINLEGYVTVSSLGSTGTTTIDGSRIKTGTISSIKINAATITGGTIEGTRITGGYIEAGTSIDVTSNVYIGDSIYLGKNSNQATYKHVVFNNSMTMRANNESVFIGSAINNDRGITFSLAEARMESEDITLYGHGNVEIRSTDNTDIIASGKLSLQSSGYALDLNSSKGISFSGNVGIFFDNQVTTANKTFRPNVADTGKIFLGHTNARWAQLYASSACNTSSDIRLKQNIRKYDRRYEAMFMHLNPVIYELKSHPGKTHCGLIAQEVKEAMNAFRISDEEFGTYEYDEETDTYGLLYEEFTSLNMHMLQKAIKEIEELKKEIVKLKKNLKR